MALAAMHDYLAAKKTDSQLKPRVLIIDDDEVNCYLLRTVFERDYQVACASDGMTGLELLANTRFDVVLLDLMIDEYDQFAVLKSIRSNAETAALPVILISSLADSADVALALAHGGNDYITKPLDLMTTRARVDMQIKLKRMNDEHKDTIKHLEGLHGIVEQVFRIVSHDLKGIFSDINMAQFMLRDMVNDNPAAHGNLDTITTSVDRMQGIVNDFLSTSVTRNGKIEAQIAPVIVEDCLWRVLEQHNAAAARKGIRLDMNEVAGAVLADEARLAQVISNLVSNAIKYAPAGSRVLLETRQTEHGTRIQVIDDGPGVPVAEREHLFEPFAQLSPRPTGGENSTGLGLWIVKHLTHIQNGRCGAAFPESGGSTFWVEFPEARTRDGQARVNTRIPSSSSLTNALEG